MNFKKTVKNYDEKEWHKVARTVMTDGVMAKFTQNPELANLLKKTGVKVIAESSKFLYIWEQVRLYIESIHSRTGKG